MKSMLLEVIGDTIINRIIDFLIEGKGIDYTKTDIANNCKISRPTLYKVFPILVKQKIIKSTRTIGRVKLYTLNTNNPRVQALMKLEELLLKQSFAQEKVAVATS